MADQRSCIGVFDRVEQTDSVAFAFEAAGAVQCRFDFDVTCNLFVAELAKSHRGDVERVQHLLAMNQRDGCQEAYFATRAGAPLGMRVFDISGLAANMLVQRSGPIGADRKTVGWATRVSVRVQLGGRRI